MPNRRRQAAEYPAMLASTTICVATVLLEIGILPLTEPAIDVVLEAAAGQRICWHSLL